MLWGVVSLLALVATAHGSSLMPDTGKLPPGFQGVLGPKQEAVDAPKTVPAPVLDSQIESILSPPATKDDSLTASDVSKLFMTSRSDNHNKLMDSVKEVASQARSTGEAAAMMGFTSPIGLDSDADASVGMDGLSPNGREDFMAKLQRFEDNMPKELTSPSGQKLSLTSFPQLLAQASSGDPRAPPMPTDVQTGVSSVPQGLRRIGDEFGSTISGMASHIGRMFGPSPSYNGPCQCRG
jgi:hypothetical protein